MHITKCYVGAGNRFSKRPRLRWMQCCPYSTMVITLSKVLVVDFLLCGWYIDLSKFIAQDTQHSSSLVGHKQGRRCRPPSVFQAELQTSLLRRSRSLELAQVPTWSQAMRTSAGQVPIEAWNGTLCSHLRRCDGGRSHIERHCRLLEAGANSKAQLMDIVMPFTGEEYLQVNSFSKTLTARRG